MPPTHPDEANYRTRQGMNSDAGTVRRYDPRKQILKLHSGRLCGDLTLLDLLYLSICSGDIVINVTPGPASTRPPVKDALFEVEVEDGEINAIFPEYMISDTARRYYCTLLNVETGSIKGIYPLGSNNFECDDGDIRLSLVGGVRHETSVDVFTKRGNQSINISPYSTSLLENAIIKCKSDKGNIYVRARFEGNIKAETEKGRIQINGPSVRITQGASNGRGRFCEAYLGTLVADLVVEAVDGDITIDVIEGGVTTCGRDIIPLRS